jgi:hypothetical protein
MRVSSELESGVRERSVCGSYSRRYAPDFVDIEAVVVVIARRV